MLQSLSVVLSLLHPEEIDTSHAHDITERGDVESRLWRSKFQDSNSLYRLSNQRGCWTARYAPRNLADVSLARIGLKGPRVCRWREVYSFRSQDPLWEGTEGFRDRDPFHQAAGMIWRISWSKITS